MSGNRFLPSSVPSRRAELGLVGMTRTIAGDDLTAQERIELIGRLWDSPDPTDAAPRTPELAAELDHREADADATPDAGVPWPEVRDDLRKKLR